MKHLCSLLLATLCLSACLGSPEEQKAKLQARPTVSAIDVKGFGTVLTEPFPMNSRLGVARVSVDEEDVGPESEWSFKNSYGAIVSLGDSLKVGDRVRILNLYWYNHTNKSDSFGRVAEPLEPQG